MKRYNYTENIKQETDEQEIDIIVGKQIMKHVKEIF